MKTIKTLKPLLSVIMVCLALASGPRHEQASGQAKSDDRVYEE